MCNYAVLTQEVEDRNEKDIFLTDPSGTGRGGRFHKRNEEVGFNDNASVAGLLMVGDILSYIP